MTPDDAQGWVAIVGGLVGALSVIIGTGVTLFKMGTDQKEQEQAESESQIRTLLDFQQKILDRLQVAEDDNAAVREDNKGLWRQVTELRAQLREALAELHEERRWRPLAEDLLEWARKALTLWGEERPPVYSALVEAELGRARTVRSLTLENDQRPQAVAHNDNIEEDKRDDGK